MCGNRTPGSRVAHGLLERSGQGQMTDVSEALRLMSSLPGYECLHYPTPVLNTRLQRLPRAVLWLPPGLSPDTDVTNTPGIQ